MDQDSQQTEQDQDGGKTEETGLHGFQEKGWIKKRNRRRQGVSSRSDFMPTDIWTIALKIPSPDHVAVRGMLPSPIQTGLVSRAAGNGIVRELATRMHGEFDAMDRLLTKNLLCSYVKIP